MSLRSGVAVALLCALVALQACGGGGGRSVTSGSSVAGATSAGSSTSSVTASDVLSPSDLERLVVAPPPPFQQRPDAELKTGLMEVGNPASGVIGIGYAKQDQLVAHGFRRGWEKAFRAPDGAVVDAYVFEFASADGPTNIVTLLQSAVSSGYEQFDLQVVPGVSAYAGKSPEGRDVVTTAIPHDRFLVGFTVGGPHAAHDYRGLVVDLSGQAVALLK